MVFLKKIAFCVCLFLCSMGFAQNLPLAGEYAHKTEKAAGAWVLKLNPDSTYKWYFTESKTSVTGHWKLSNEEIILQADATKKETKFKVLSAEDSERAVLYYKKDFYFKK